MFTPRHLFTPIVLGLGLTLLTGEPAMTATPASIEPADAPACDMQQDRYARGLERLNQITKGQGQAVVEALSRTSPDLARFVIEYPYGDVACRPGLTLPQRQLATVAALAALGFAAPELKVHIHGALNVGVTEDEIIETMILMSVYAGFPAALHGLRSAREVFDDRAGASQ